MTEGSGVNRTLPTLAAALIALAGCSSNPPDLVVPPPHSSGSAAASASASASSAQATMDKILPYPDNRAGDLVFTLHGKSVADPYRWLEDADKPEVKTWLDAQGQLARTELDKLQEREALSSRLKALLYIDSLSAPRKRGNRYFFTRRHADREKGIVYVRDGKQGKERVLFDPNGWSTDGSVSLGSWVPSWDGKKVAYLVKQNNSDEATLKVLDVDTMKDSDVIEGAKYAWPSWTPKGDGFYYTWLPPVGPGVSVADRPGFAEVRFHPLGADSTKDSVVHPKLGDATKFVGAEISKDGKVFFLSIENGWTSNDLFFRDGNDPSQKLVQLGSPGKAHYRAEAHKGYIYVTTDEGAPRWRVFRVDPKKPARDAWVEIVKEDPRATLDGSAIIGDKLALTYLERASNRMELRNLDGTPHKKVELPGIGSIAGPVGLPDDPEAYFSFESYTSPTEIYELSAKTGAATLSSKVDVPIDASTLTTEQVEYTSKDGTVITMFVVRPKDIKLDGSNRVLLYGYGGFQSNETPSFRATMFPWLERGGIVAFPNLRGGAEYGETWHQGGMLLKKQNVFDDFIGAAEFLIAKGYTRSERLVIMGASNGGLLVGAAMTQRPDLFAGVICGVPLLDMVRYHLFGSGKTWVSEYGSSDDPEQFQALLAYSPYHHVKKGVRYPALLLMSADHDDRVDPMHARKFAAAMQDASTGGPVLLRVERNAGHGGADLRKSDVEKGTDRLSFALAATSGHW
ncbi:MAG: prolyl oligopeptidase family serine peptidase [Polyangiaceae bacterium]